MLDWIQGGGGVHRGPLWVLTLMEPYMPVPHWPKALEARGIGGARVH